MDSRGVRVELDELGKELVLASTKTEIVHRLADAYAVTPEYKDLLNSIKIDRNEVRKIVLDKLIDEIINEWARKHYD